MLTMLGGATSPAGSKPVATFWPGFCFLLAIGMAMLRNALAFNLFGIFGIAWLASMAIMVTSARVRTDFEPAWSDKMLRRSWQIYSYALHPWRVIHSLAVLGVGR